LTLIAKEASLLLTGFSILFFSGFLLANSILICASFIPLFVYFVGVFIATPEVQIKKTGVPSSVGLGEIIEVKMAGMITGGLGAVVICDEVPEPFQLVEGSNYKVVSKEVKDKAFSFSYKIRCTKCGNHWLGTGWQTRHILGMTHTQISKDDLRQLRVFPALAKIEKMKPLVRMTTRTKPSGSVATIGSLSTDFKEIRDYLYGDPFKIINWKASARAACRGKRYPLVNEYEKEGKASIWLFLDADPNIRVGNSIENTLEYSVRAAYSISRYFLGEGYSLGMYIYNHRGELVHFDTGKRQFIRIANRLLKLASSRGGLQVFWDEGFSRAVEHNQRYLITRFPRIVVITHVTSRSYSDLLNGVRKTLAYKRRRRQPDVLVINILSYSNIPTINCIEASAAKMLDMASRSLSDQLRRLGSTVLDWDPKKETMEATLLSAMQLR